ncbi:hypothetical protein EV175_003300 [Coemansia sp. RSA 1933]|nr:hypothetical protein EV175_003300 [Coemansia sp. RSA 1933]
MSYVEHGAQASQYLRSFVWYVHGQAHPLCAMFTQQMSQQWPPFQTALNIVGPATFTYLLELVFLYVIARFAISLFKIVSTTLYRILRFMLLVVFVVLVLVLGLYVYFTDASNGQTLADLTKGNFWLNKASSFASMVVPVWNDELAKWQGGQKKPQQTHAQKKFSYQGQTYM